MTIIKQLCKMIREELDDAEKYAKEYALVVEKDARLADMFKRLANAELEHATWEHTEATRLIRESGQPTPEAMQAVWDWEHELMIEQTAKVRQMLAM